MNHPRFTELLLDGFIADHRMREGILGDLAEEWADRAERQGSHAANLWYCAQAIRSAPALIVEWIRRTGWLVALGALAFGTGMRIVTGLLGAITMAAIAWSGATIGMDRWALTGVSSVGSAAWTFVGAWIVARLAPRAPVPVILWMVLVVYMTNISVTGPLDHGLIYQSYGLIEKLLSMVAVVAGGVVGLRAQRRAAATRAEAPS